jgi:hypothetical protein
MTTPAVALYVPTYATRNPYLTTAEYLAEPTGVDLSQLIPGATSQAVNEAALATLIRSASSYADSLCYQVLGATLDTQAGEYRIFRDGTIRVPVDYTPLVEVTAVSLGWAAGQLSALTDLSGLWLQRKVVRIPVGPSLISGAGYVFTAPARYGHIFAQVLYVNGFANTTLAADVSAAASSVTVASPLGIFPGLPMTIYDDAVAKTEMVTVANTYVQGSTTVPLVSPLVNAHTSGTAISALPRAIKQAVTALTTHLIKTRGAESMALASVSGGPAMQQAMPGSTEEYDLAVDLLHPFRRPM